MNEAKKYLDELSYEEQQLLLLNLIGYTYKKAQGKRWRTGNHFDLSDGETVDSIPSLAIEKVLTGERVWNPEKNPDFKGYLFDVIDSLLSHLATGKDNRLFVNENDKRFSSDAEKEDVNVLAVARNHFITSKAENHFDGEWLVRDELTAEEQLIAEEEKQYNDKILRKINEKIVGDTDLEEMIAAMNEGYEKPSDIEKFTGIPAKRLYNARKRLNTVVSQVRKEFDI